MKRRSKVTGLLLATLCFTPFVVRTCTAQTCQDADLLLSNGHIVTAAALSNRRKAETVRPAVAGRRSKTEGCGLKSQTKMKMAQRPRVSGGRALETGESSAARSRDGLLIIPRKPLLRGFRHSGGVLLEAHQIIKRVDPIEFTGVDKAHVNVADSGPVQRFKTQGVFPMEYRHFESAFGHIIIKRGAGHR